MSVPGFIMTHTAKSPRTSGPFPQFPRSVRTRGWLWMGAGEQQQERHGISPIILKASPYPYPPVTKSPDRLHQLVSNVHQS